jgi:multidrug efflux pump subunit AcrA (membrane-fusion protein)
MQGAKTVMVVDAKNTVSVRTVRLGDKADKDVIVLEGLTPGERVIVEGMQKVRPGGQVNPTTATGNTVAKTQGS